MRSKRGSDDSKKTTSDRLETEWGPLRRREVGSQRLSGRRTKRAMHTALKQQLSRKIEIGTEGEKMRHGEQHSGNFRTTRKFFVKHFAAGLIAASPN